MSATVGPQVAVGRACPYCRFTLKQDIPAVACPSCSSVHHADCWSENGGCAVVACASGPKGSASPPTIGQATPPPPPRDTPQVQPAAPAPERHRSDLSKLLVAALLLLALAVGGAAVAIALSRGGDAKPVATRAAKTVVVTQPAAKTVTQEPADGNEADVPPPASAPDAAELESVLRRYFGAVKRGDFDSAYALLSPTYKHWKASNGARPQWERQETDNMLYLSPGDLSVTVESYDPSADIATIDVRGMQYREPGKPTCPYVGITWMRRFDGRWYYDQGYMQRAERRAEWRPRQRETLGFPCQDGY